MNRTSGTALVAVQGPRSAEILITVTDADLAARQYCAWLPAQISGIDVLLARTGCTGEDASRSTAITTEPLTC